MTKGYLCLVLHAHLPFVRHPDHARWLEEDWLYEAIVETYLPLLRTCQRLVEHGAKLRLTVSLSPTLTAMLEDELLRERFLGYVDRLIELARKEVERTKWMPEFQPLAVRYLELFELSRREFIETYGRDLLAAFRRFSDAGAIEIITCGATHGFLPLMLGNRNLWRAQIAVAANEHRRHFGAPPRGIWLPECGYEPGVEEVLASQGVRYTFTDTHGVLHATPRPKHGVYAPIVTESGVAVFARDQQSSRQVWSAEAGYPGHAAYREFYRDIGWDLDYDYVQPYLHSDGRRTNLGIKYHRITKQADHKEPYDFAKAQEQAAVHAADFLQRRVEQVRELAETMDRPPIVVAPYDAELFGHWWFEGPQWLEYLVLKLHHDQTEIEMTTPSDYLDRHGPGQPATPSMSSWGHNGFCEYWLDPANDWLYPHVQGAGERMVELARRYPDPERLDPATRRALAQAAREVLLLQASDWAFILRTGTVVEYAKWRAEGHIKAFNKLYRDIPDGTIDESWLAALEGRDNLFPEIDYRVFAAS
jgi:1,4-alpha-glucan branching enzyme